MNEGELKALVSLLDDEDSFVFEQVSNKIKSLGEEIIPFLEHEWEIQENSLIQERIEMLIHTVQFNNLFRKLEKWKEDGAKNLLEGMFLIASYSYPDLDYLSLEQQIKQLSAEAKVQLNNDEHPYDQVRDLNRFFFSLNRFRANKKNFHSPGNSFLNVVLETRKGNPLTLSSIYLLVAQNLNLPIYGVNFPNLFILTYKNDDKQFYINVYNSGLIFTTEDVDNYLQQIKMKPNERFYQPCSNEDIIARSLRNLVVSYTQTKEKEHIKEIETLLSIFDSKDSFV